LNTQHIIAHETGIPQVVDPLGGSYYIESLTDTIEKSIEEYMKKIDGAGGMVKAIETGWAQKEISKAAFHHHKDIEEGRRVIVGANKFHKEKGREIETHEANPAVVKEMQKRLARLRKERDNAALVDALDRLRKAAQGEDNIVPSIVGAVKSNATIGEISGVLRDVFGEYNPTFF
jgi:methylmalonyl-CoA mutase N-terminal domain/subunit